MPIPRHSAYLSVAATLLLAPIMELAPRRPVHQPPADARATLLVTPAWLAEHLKDPDLVLLHVGEKAEYDRAHLPGARYVSMRDVSVSSMDHARGLMLELPSPDSLRAQLQALGISDRSRVVVYYGNDWVSPATRIVFTLDHAGLGARTSLLDGGMTAWSAAGHPTTAEVPARVAGKLSPLRTRPLVVDADYVRARVNAPGNRVIDARAAVFYDGVEGNDARRGHVAGARSLPYTQVTDDRMRLRSADELAALFRAAGVGPRDTVVAYCHIGQQATAVLFAARTLGNPVRLFDGSYQEWGRRAELPVENPSARTEREREREAVIARVPRPYADPYLTGVGLGLVLLAAFVLVGRGLGASGAFATAAATVVDAAAPAAARANPFFADHLDAGGLLRDWLVVEVIGVVIGGFASAALAGRLRLAVDRGPRTSVRERVLLAIGGGAIMGAGAVLARGCTSGQALTGGALLSVGSWLFVGGAFAAAYGAAWALRRVWT